MTGYFRYLVVLVVAGLQCLASSMASHRHRLTRRPAFPLWTSGRPRFSPETQAALKALYSTDPVAQVQANGIVTSPDADVNFWLGLKARSMKLEIVAVTRPAQRHERRFQSRSAVGEWRRLERDRWPRWRKQGEQWRLISVERADAPHLKQPSDMKKNIYPSDADAHAEIKEAEEKAAKEHRRVLLVFGANWCFDCHVLDLAFHRPDFASAMSGYEVVHVDLGDDEKKNADVVKQFDVTLDKGIPTLAVVEADGRVVVSQKNGEFEDARSLTPETVLEFLNEWKPEAR